MIRYLLDEHVDPVIQRELRRRNSQIEVYRIGGPDAPPLGTLDPEILIWIEKYEFLLVTSNRSSMPVHLSDHLAAGGHIPGILLFRPSVSLGRIIDELELIWSASQMKEYADQITFIPL